MVKSMTTTVKQKLRDTRGASFLIALMCFIILAMVVAVIVSAALTTVKQQHDDEITQQNLLSSQSAALSLGSLADGSTMTIAQVDELDASGNVLSTSYEVTETTGNFKDELAAAGDWIKLDDGTTYRKKNVCSVKATVKDNNADAAKAELDMGVTVDMTMLPRGNEDEGLDYQLTFKIENNDDSAIVYMKMNARQNKSDPVVNGTTRTTTVKYTWENPTYSTTNTVS